MTNSADSLTDAFALLDQPNESFASTISQFPMRRAMLDESSFNKIGQFQPDLGARRSTFTDSFTQNDLAEPVDWSIVVKLRREASELINSKLEDLATGQASSFDSDDRRMLGRATIRQVVHNYAGQLTTSGKPMWPLAMEYAYAQAVEDAIFGYGRLQPLFEIDDAENIEIHGFDSVVIQHSDGRRTLAAKVADSDDELVEAIRFLGANANPPRPFDDAHPMMTLALGDKYRLHAIGFGLSYRPSIVIRQHILTRITLTDLVAKQMLPQPLANLLAAAVLAKKSIVISGDQGAGKTTLLRALIAAIPEAERFGTLETDYELLTHLQPNRKNILALQAKTGLGELQEGKAIGAYSVADLIPEALRQNLTRLIVGEVRGSEAGAMFEAMTSGAGTMSTTHSHSASSTMDRLAARVAQGGTVSMVEAYQQIAFNLHLLVHVNLVDDTWRGGLRRRFVAEVRSVTGAIENSRPVTHLIYRAATEDSPALYHPDLALTSELARFEATTGGFR